jgi:hypothetical protein
LNAEGFLFHDKGAGRYRIASMEKLSDLTMNGNMITFDRFLCTLTSEGKINFGVNYDLLTLSSSGRVIHNTDASSVELQSIMGLSFFFSPEALQMMAEDIRTVPTLKAVNLSSEFNRKAMRDLLGVEAAKALSEELQLFGMVKTLPKQFSYQLMLNEVNFEWNPNTMSFMSKGKIGIGFIGNQPLNIYVDGWVELQRKRSGDILDIYLKANDNVWYWFSYFRGVMMSYSSNTSYNALLGGIKDKLRKDPKSNAQVEYEYMIGPRDRLTRFIRRMESGGKGYEDEY